MVNWIKDRPWILVVVAFVVLIASWVALLYLANKHRPESVPLQVAPLKHES